MKPPSPIKRFKEELSQFDENVIRPTVISNGDHNAVRFADERGERTVSLTKNNHSANCRASEAQDSYFEECIRLHSERKINEKNAFSLSLIDYVHSMLMNGELGNFQVATPLLAAGTTIYAARVDAIHKKCRKIASKLSNARFSSPTRSPERTPQSSGEPPGTPVAAATRRSSHRGARPRLLTSTNLMRARLARAPYDDLLFRQGAAAGDQTLADQAQLHGIVGAEGEEAEEDLLRSVRIPFDPRLLQRGLEISPESCSFVFLPEPVPLVRPCQVALCPLEMIKMSDMKQELKEEEEEREEEEGDAPEELCLPHVTSVTGAIFPKEIVCQSVEEYVDLLRENFACMYSLPTTGDLPELHRLQRKSARKRPYVVFYDGQQAQAKRKRASQASQSAKRKRPRVVRRRVTVKVEMLERQLDLEPPVELEEPEEEVEMEARNCPFKISSLFSDSEDELLMSEPRFALDLSFSRSPSAPALNVHGLIQWLRRFLKVKAELGSTRRFARILEHARRSVRRELSPAMLLFALLHVAERERLQLRESGFDIEVCSRT